jgi:hypothetical protein
MEQELITLFKICETTLTSLLQIIFKTSSVQNFKTNSPEHLSSPSVLVVFCIAPSLVFCVVFCLAFCSFSFDHSIVRPSSPYAF